jgi:hypothetical protein
MRIAFKLDEYEPMVVRIGNETISYRGSQIFAQIANVPAGIYEEVRITDDGRTFYVTVVGEGDHDAYGVGKGWYAARWVSHDEAKKIRESWGVLRPQEGNPFNLLRE